MTRYVTLGVVIATSLLAACHYASDIGYIRDDLPPGRPYFVAGSPEGYWIWRDRQGWHLRTTSDAPRRFQGTIETVGGGVSTVRPIGRADGAVHHEGANIDFDYSAAGGEQGFDWTASSGCSRFDLYIDGTTRPLRVFLGRIEDSPSRIPFAVCG